MPKPGIKSWNVLFIFIEKILLIFVKGNFFDNGQLSLRHCLHFPVVVTDRNVNCLFKFIYVPHLSKFDRGHLSWVTVELFPALWPKIFPFQFDFYGADWNNLWFSMLPHLWKRNHFTFNWLLRLQFFNFSSALSESNYQFFRIRVLINVFHTVLNIFCNLFNARIFFYFSHLCGKVLVHGAAGHTLTWRLFQGRLLLTT